MKCLPLKKKTIYVYLYLASAMKNIMLTNFVFIWSNNIFFTKIFDTWILFSVAFPIPAYNCTDYTYSWCFYENYFYHSETLFSFKIYFTTQNTILNNTYCSSTKKNITNLLYNMHVCV